MIPSAGDTHVKNASNELATVTALWNHTTVTDGYDAKGAATFTIAVILTYTLSIICLIASFSFRKKKAIQQDQEATNYLKYRNEVTHATSKVCVLYSRIKAKLDIFCRAHVRKI